MSHNLDTAKNPDASPNALSVLARSSDITVCLAVAENPNTDVEDLNVLADTANTQTLLAVIRHPNATSTIIRQVLNNQDWTNDLSLKLVKDEQTSSAILEELASWLSNTRALAALNKKPEMPIETLEGLVQCRKEFSILFELQKNPKTPKASLETMLKQLVSSGDVDAQMSLACQHAVPSDTLKKLAEHSSNSDVLIAVSRHPNTVIEIQTLLSERGDYDVYFELQKNARVPKALLDNMLERLAFSGCNKAISRKTTLSWLSDPSYQSDLSVYDTGFAHLFKKDNNGDFKTLKQSYLRTCWSSEVLDTDTDQMLFFLYRRWLKTPLRYCQHTYFIEYLDDLIDKKYWLEREPDYFFDRSTEEELNSIFWDTGENFKNLTTLPTFDLMSIDSLYDIKDLYLKRQDRADARSHSDRSISTGFEIPPQPEPLVFNASRIADIKTESEEVTAMLDDIYESEDSGFAIEDVSEMESMSPLKLNKKHLEIVKHLAKRPEWSREELVPIMSGLMIDGVIEHINDAFLDYCEDVFIEGYDPIEINIDLYEEIFK